MKQGEWSDLFVEMAALMKSGPHDPESDEGYRLDTLAAILAATAGTAP